MVVVAEGLGNEVELVASGSCDSVVEPVSGAGSVPQDMAKSKPVKSKALAVDRKVTITSEPLDRGHLHS